MNETDIKVEKRGKKRFIKKAVIGLFIFILLIGLAVAGGYISYSYVIDSQDLDNIENISSIDVEDEIALEIPLGSNTETIANILKEKGLIRYPFIFKILSKVNGYDGTYQSGIHIVSSEADYNTLNGYDTLMRIIASKPQDNPTITVTIPEGYTFKQTTSLLLKEGLIEMQEFERIAKDEPFDYRFIKDIPEREYRLEGYLFPDTYKFDTKAGDKETIRKMLDNFNNKFRSEYYERAAELDMTVDEIIVLASIVEREARIPEERDIISGVFHNRLNTNKTAGRLESCATIQYIYLEKDGVVKETITEEDTKIDHLYNTYIIKGLPPGPICAPGEASIMAALYPKETEYLYFGVNEVKGDGSHVFSKTFREHINAMNKYGK